MILREQDCAALLKAFPRGVVAFDIETTGLSPLADKIIELSAVKIDESGFSTFDQLVNPQIKIPEFTIDIHGIKDLDVENKPTINEVLPKFLEFIGDLPLIAHNAKFDVGFIVYDIHQLGLTFNSNPVYCSVKFSRMVFDKDVENHKLGTLAETLNIPLENHHRALDDAFASLMVFAYGLEKQLQKNNKINLGDSLLFKLHDFKKNTDLDIPEKLKGLISKAEKKQLVDIKYNGGSKKGEWRPVRPIALLPLPDGNILYAHCIESDLYKSFALKKVVEFRELNADEIKQRLESLAKRKKK
ncbi:MAG: hypothetical protein Fur0010_23670 [Bdellovibrio sp.]